MYKELLILSACQYNLLRWYTVHHVSVLLYNKTVSKMILITDPSLCGARLCGDVGCDKYAHDKQHVNEY